MELGLPIQAGQLQDHSHQVKSLTLAYQLDYGMPHIVQYHNCLLLWCKKFNFNDIYHCCTFKCGDFIQYQFHTISQVEYVLIYEAHHDEQRFFILVKQVYSKLDMNSVLGLPQLWLSFRLEFVGLPAVDSIKQYILPMKEILDGYTELDSEGSQELLQVTWTVQYL